MGVLCAGAAFAINWLAFIPSYLKRTEHYFDLVGSLTHLTLILVALVGSTDLDLRAIVASILVGVWAARLGSFLFSRARKMGGDGRFDTIKHHPGTFFHGGLSKLLGSSHRKLFIGSYHQRRATVFRRVCRVGVLLWEPGSLWRLYDRQKRISI